MTSVMDASTPPPGPSGPAVVSQFEYNLLRILRFLLGHTPVEQAAPLIERTFEQ